ncbi:MAG: hypothetical protein H0X15_15250, partial [Acidobacteria bacterium]|nr:hypothetical protein [Acidobacteriota bacterium]
QRVTALTAAILGEYVVDKTYQRVKIKIAFNPLSEKFEVQNPAILKDKTWLHDISEAISGKIDLFEIAESYFESNPEVDKKQVRNAFTNLINITNKPVGIIELAHDLDIETVTEIFIRINSKGVVLSQADFAMSKIAANINYNGNELRKAIDYFCHLAIAPEFYKHIVDNDKEFAASEFFQKMQWLKTENEDLYDPDYTDLIRVAFTSQFNRGRLSDLVSLLSGRNFETRTFEDSIAEQSFATLKKGVINFINKDNFEKFLMIVKSAGFVSPKLIRSQNALNFAYVIYLKLRELGVNPVSIESYVRRWLVYSILTTRYSGSPESFFDYDIKQIAERPFDEYLKEKEEGELSDAFWNAALPQSLDTSVASSPYFHVFLASQVKANDKGFLSKNVTVNDLISLRGDIHHLFPKDYLKKNGLDRGKYNQIANYVYMQSEINIKVGNKPPKDYFELINAQIAENNRQLSGLSTEQEVSENLKMNCVPVEIMQMSFDDYSDFLIQRRKLMANKIKDYYFSL